MPKLKEAVCDWTFGISVVIILAFFSQPLYFFLRNITRKKFSSRDRTLTRLVKKWYNFSGKKTFRDFTSRKSVRGKSWYILCFLLFDFDRKNVNVLSSLWNPKRPKWKYFTVLWNIWIFINYFTIWLYCVGNILSTGFLQIGACCFSEMFILF